MPVDLWQRGESGVGFRYNTIEVVASKRPCVGPAEPIVCGLTIPMKLRLFYWQGDRVSPREVRASGVIEEI